jgi:hypothetical protein
VRREFNIRRALSRGCSRRQILLVIVPMALIVAVELALLVRVYGVRSRAEESVASIRNDVREVDAVVRQRFRSADRLRWDEELERNHDPNASTDPLPAETRRALSACEPKVIARQARQPLDPDQLARLDENALYLDHAPQGIGEWKEAARLRRAANRAAGYPSLNESEEALVLAQECLHPRLPEIQHQQHDAGGTP